MKNKLYIAVFGSDEDHCSPKSLEIARKVGEYIAKSGAVLLSGGGSGVMEAASQGAYEHGGTVVGILPGADKQKGNSYCSITIPTEIGFARGQVLTNSADSVIVVEGGIGTAIEARLAYWIQIPILALPKTGGEAEVMADTYFDKRGLIRVNSAESPEEAVEKAVQLGRNRLDLRQRLQEVGLDLDIYKKVPHKYIRINPRNPINVGELEKKLKDEYGVETTFSETGVPNVYRSSNSDIGGLISNQRNELFMKHYFIQDFASVLAVYVLGLQEGDSYLDLCAAPGFKTILAHDFANGKLDITALDVDQKRFERLQRFLRQDGIEAKLHLADSTIFQGGKYDKVLVDAECSCEGMIVKYDSDIERDVSGIGSVLKRSSEDVEELTKLQLQLLQNGFNHLKERGVLVYATCAMNKYENEEVVRKFLLSNPDAKVEVPDMSQFDVDAKVSDLGVRVIPGRTRGLYFTRIVRNSTN
tara:strand:- start:215 stop:1630 length:1416 start_codon:yes stop_codon:yes gene_type:complete